MWQDMSDLGDSGYVYFRGQSVLRIRQDKPRKGNLSVTCYRHHGGECRGFVPDGVHISDKDVMVWCVAVPSEEFLDEGERKALGARHRALFKQRFNGPEAAAKEAKDTSTARSSAE